jgi:FkbM family methyltransferase
MTSKRNVFVDVGGNVGQTVAIILNGSWKFDHIHTFEPDPECANTIRTRFSDAIATGKLSVHQAALGRADGEAILTGSNAKGDATTVRDFIADDARSVKCRMVDAAKFVDELASRGDAIYMKVNCEGAEIEILDRLCELEKVDAFRSIMVHFDIVYSPGGYYAKRRVLSNCRAKRLPVLRSEHVLVGKSYEAKIANWLAYQPELLPENLRTPPRAQLLKRRFRYFIRDMRSAIGGGKPGYRQ